MNEEISRVLESYNQLNLKSKKIELFNLVEKVSKATGELLKANGAKPIFNLGAVESPGSLKDEAYLNELFKQFLLMENNLLFLFALENEKNK